jgi:DNA-binding transcriptional LysR family regulator
MGVRLNGSEADPVSGRDLVAFVAAVESASVHGAADALGLTQSAVSKRIHALERRVGTQLLHRGRQGVRPTAAGQLLYPEAKHVLVSLARVARVAAIAGERAHHDLRLAASHTIGEFLLPTWLATLRGGGELHVQVDVTNSPGVLAELREGAVDVGFVEGNDALHGLEAMTLLRDELIVAVAPDHRWAGRRRLSPSELMNERYLARERDSGTRAVAAERLARHGVALTPALEIPSTQGLKRAVLGGGYTIVSLLAARAEIDSGALCALSVRGVDLARELRAVRRPQPTLTGAAERLWSWLARALSTDELTG